MSKTKTSKVSRRSGQHSWLSGLSRSKIIVIAAFILVFAGAGVIYFQNSRAATINGLTCVNYKFTEYRFSGQCVKDIQFGLNKAGKYYGTIDGIYGPQTRSAVLSYGYSTIYGKNSYNNNGEVGVRTWNDLCTLGSTWALDKFPSTANDMGCSASLNYPNFYDPYYGRY